MTNKPIQNNTPFSIIVKAWTTADGAVKTDITSATSGLQVRYWKEDAAVVTSVSPASQTSAGAHTDGGIVHKYEGSYRVDIPAIDDTGATYYVTLGGLAGVNFSVAQVFLAPFDPSAASVDANIVSVNGKTTPERSLSWAGLFRTIGAMVAGRTANGGTTSEQFKGLRNDGTAGKTRVTIGNDGADRTSRTIDETDD